MEPVDVEPPARVERDRLVEALARPFRPAERAVDPFGPICEPRPPRELVPFIRWALADVRPAIVWLALFSILSGAAEALLFYLIGGLVDRAAAAGPAALFREEWPWLLVMLGAVVVLKPAANLGQSAMTSLALGPGINPLAIWRLHRHTLGQSMRYFEEDFTGRISQKQMQTGMALASVVIDALSSLGMLAAYLVTMVVLLAAAEPWLALAVGAWITAYAAAIRWAVPRVRARAKARAAARASVTGQLVDSLSHIKTVKLFAHGRREEAAARGAITRYREAALAFGRAMMAMRVLIQVLNATLTIALVTAALWLFHVGEASLGVVAMAAMMTLRLTAMSNWIAQAALSIFGELGTIEDGAQTLSHPHEVVDRPSAADPSPVEGRLAFENVTFGYGGAVGGVKGFSLQVEPGEKVGLVGPSGAGKSTVVSLLLRLYDVEAGRVSLDGTDVRELTQDGLRRSIATVTQETAIFNRSALDNILYGRPEAGAKAAMEAARRARAHEFIETLRDGRGRTGYDAHLGERGVKLSGGQRQRIALARAMLKDAKVLVLDEATSALDSQVEADIQDALAKLMTGKTVIAIAHRLSTIAAMDRIVVMDGGQIVESGAHDVLARRGGLYASLWERQSGGFLVAAE